MKRPKVTHSFPPSRYLPFVFFVSFRVQIPRFRLCSRLRGRIGKLTPLSG